VPKSQAVGGSMHRPGMEVYSKVCTSWFHKSSVV